MRVKENCVGRFHIFGKGVLFPEVISLTTKFHVQYHFCKVFAHAVCTPLTRKVLNIDHSIASVMCGVVTFRVTRAGQADFTEWEFRGEDHTATEQKGITWAPEPPPGEGQHFTSSSDWIGATIFWNSYGPRRAKVGLARSLPETCTLAAYTTD